MEKKREKHFFKTVKTPDGYTVKKWFPDRINNGNPSVLQKCGSRTILSVAPTKPHFSYQYALSIYSILEKNPHNKVAYHFFTRYRAAISLAHSGQCSSRFGYDQYRHCTLFPVLSALFF
jgi:hypothetical protein